MTRISLPCVCLVTDRPLCRGRSLVEVVARALAGGVTMVQVREKEADTEIFIELARAVRDCTRRHGVPLIINDRVDVALAVGAEGVHLGQRDVPPEEARRMLGAEAIIGLSVESDADVIAAEGRPVDYYGISPVFATSTKRDHAPALGLDGVRRLRGLTRRPLIGIGGIHAANAGAVVAAGADGVAVVSAVCAAEDPEEAARALAAAVLPVREVR
jgi:thiamine-phosphate pyrophosphorylase